MVRPLTAARASSTNLQELALADGSIVAVDALGAGPGELVLVAHGSRCRDLTVGAAVAAKDVVIAIVDQMQVNR